jgi:hypothetical protein
MKLLAMVKDPASIACYLAAVGEATEVPRRFYSVLIFCSRQSAVAIRRPLASTGE